MKYDTAYVYTKKGSLMPCIITKMEKAGRSFYALSQEDRDRLERCYGKETNIELVIMFRRHNGKLFCRIKCPVNPLPIKGEFEVVTVTSMLALLEKLGWESQRHINPRLFD